MPPRLPRRIGVVTSPSGAALHDVLIALRRRSPGDRGADLSHLRARRGAADEICRTLKLADKRAECDVLILTRGGGSLEDLWAFNEESVARTIAALELPIIVGVGHEIDFTIADFAADLRAPTPSQAAELAVPDQSEWLTRFARLEQQIAFCMRRRLGTDRRHFASLEHRLSRCHPGILLREQHQRLDELEQRARHALERGIANAKVRSTGLRLGRARESGAPAREDPRALALGRGAPAARDRAQPRRHEATREARGARARFRCPRSRRCSAAMRSCSAATAARS